MEDLAVQDIYVYPIKSLGGISLEESEVVQTGLRNDRRWMLTDEKYIFMTQRTCTEMALLQVNLGADGLVVTHKTKTFTPLEIPFYPEKAKEVTVSVWDDVCDAFEVSPLANEWFSNALKTPVKLVYMPDSTHRFVEKNFAKEDEIVSFADAYPLLMIGQSSLDDLNAKLKKPVPMARFRPNIVFKGGAPYFEDSIHTFEIGGLAFTAAKPCARCVITTIDTELAIKETEPLKTLAAYRSNKNKVLFGQNLLCSNTGFIKVGDKLIVKELKNK